MTYNIGSKYKYPVSQNLGAVPCGENPNETCKTTNNCTPVSRFKDGDNDLAISRKELRQANNRVWMNSSYIHIDSQAANYSPLTNIMHMTNIPTRVGSLTPFRVLTNAGDPANTFNEPIAGPNTQAYSSFNPLYTKAINQVSSTRRSSNSSAVFRSGRLPTTNNSDGALWSGNNKWVYDGSDYTRFKKLQAKNRNYNDPSFGGDRYHASQGAIRRVRH